MDKFGFEKVSEKYYAVYCGPTRVGFVKKTSSLWWTQGKGIKQTAFRTRKEAAKKLIEQARTSHAANI